MKNKPRIRFKGFTEDWEPRKLNEFLIVSNIQNTENKYDKNDVLSVSGEYGIVNQINFQGRSFAGTSVSNYGVVEIGDIVYTKSPLKLNPYGVIKTNRFNTGIVSTLYAIYKTKENCDSKFIEHYFNLDDRLNKYLKPLVNKGAKNTLMVSSENALIGEVCFPQVTEQRLIADLLDCLDKYITLHQRKLEKLKLAKKALLQKLFPKNGSQFPELRFKGFADAWEQCKLGNLLILLKDGSHGTHKNTSEGVYLLSAKNIKNGRINIMPDDRIISWDDYNVIHKNYELQIGDILLTIVGSIGETAIYNLKMKVTFQRSVAFLRPNSKLKNGFLYTLINTDRFQNQLQTKQVVSAQPGIYLGDLASINITYPKNVSEQEKIYNIFKGIEDSITLHQRKLDKLQEVKKGLLQKMFV